MPESQTSAAPACSSAFSCAISCGGRGGAVARVEVRQLRPAAFAGEQERGLAFLPRDRPAPSRADRAARSARRDGGRARRCAARARRARRAARASPRHRGERRPLGRARRPGSSHARSDPSGSTQSSTPRHRHAARRAPAARPPRAPRRSASSVLGEIMNARCDAIVLAAGGAVLHRQAERAAPGSRTGARGPGAAGR